MSQQNTNAIEVLEKRVKRLDCFSYKLDESGQFGLDVPFSDKLDIDESTMSVVIPFADGNRRDGVGDLLEIGGIRTERHRVNPVVLFDHGKAITLPIALAEDPKTKHYTVELDSVNKQARCKAFFYQGKGMGGLDHDGDHGLFCEQLFDLIAKRYIRAGSIGYQAVKAMKLPADYATGTPEGLHLLVTNLLEASAVVVPANQDTVLKALSLPQICGKPLSPYLVKSLSPYAPKKKAQLGYEGTKTTVRTRQNTRATNQPMYRVEVQSTEGNWQQFYNTPDLTDAEEHAAVITQNINRYRSADQQAANDYNPQASWSGENGKGMVRVRRDDSGVDPTHVINARDSQGQQSRINITSSSQAHAEHLADVNAAYLEGRTGEPYTVDSRPQSSMAHENGKNIVRVRRDSTEGGYAVTEHTPTGTPISDINYQNPVDAQFEAERIVRGRHNQDIRIPTRLDNRPNASYAGENAKSYRNYENELSNSDVPPPRWKPGVGATKSQQIRFRLRQKAVEIRSDPSSLLYEVTQHAKDGRQTGNPTYVMTDDPHKDAQAEARRIQQTTGGPVIDRTTTKAIRGIERTHHSISPLRLRNRLPLASTVPSVGYSPLNVEMGAVKALRSKYREKAVHIEESRRYPGNVRVIDRGKAGDAANYSALIGSMDDPETPRMTRDYVAVARQHAGGGPVIDNTKPKAIHISREGSWGYRVVDRGKTGEPSSDRNSTYSHRYSADEQARRFSEQTNQQIIDETKPRQQVTNDEKSLSNVKSVRLRYRSKAESKQPQREIRLGRSHRPGTDKKQEHNQTYTVREYEGDQQTQTHGPEHGFTHEDIARDLATGITNIRNTYRSLNRPNEEPARMVDQTGGTT